MICPKPIFADELNSIKIILLKNGYPEGIINTTIRYKCMQFSNNLKYGPEKCLVYLKLPCIGNASMQLIEQMN